jgi:hypothetical protein
MMQRTSFENVLAGLDRALALFRQIGLAEEVEASRFAEYRRRLRQFVDARAQPERIDEVMKEDSDTERAIAGVAQVESLELADLVPFLKTCEQTVLQPKVRAILGGPVLPTDEDQASNQARNIMFELSLASKLARTGLAPQLGEHPDLQCEIEGKPLWIECKRPLSAGKVGRRIGEAYRQLYRDMTAAPPGARGIIAVSLSKLVNRGDTFLSYTNEHRASAFLSDELQRLADRSEPSRRNLPPVIVGLLFHVMTPAVYQESGTMVLADQLNMQERAAPHTADHRAFRRFGEALRAIADQRG